MKYKYPIFKTSEIWKKKISSQGENLKFGSDICIEMVSKYISKLYLLSMISRFYKQ